MSQLWRKSPVGQPTMRTRRLPNLAVRIMAVVFVILTGLAGGLSTGVAGQVSGSITVQAFICPEKYPAAGWDEDCDQMPEVEAAVYLDASEFGDTGQTDAHGTVVFTGLGSGSFIVELGVPDDVAEFASYCELPEQFERLETSGSDTNRLTVPLGEGDSITCTFNVTPLDSRGEPVMVAAPDVLPSTGVGTLVSEPSGLTTVFMLIGLGLLFGGFGFWTAREE